MGNACSVNGSRKFLVIDTETTGLCKDDLPLAVAAAVMDERGRVVASLDFLLQPPRAKSSPFRHGWPKSSPFHHVTAEAAVRHGVPFTLALDQIWRMADAHGVREVVAYNAKFDERMLRQARAASIGRPDVGAPDGSPPDPSAGFWDLQWVCALALARKAGPGRNAHTGTGQHRRTAEAARVSYKLCDVYLRLFSTDEHAVEVCWHDALEDAVAAGRVYAHLVRSGAATAAQAAQADDGGPRGGIHRSKSDDALFGRDQDAGALLCGGGGAGGRAQRLCGAPCKTRPNGPPCMNPWGKCRWH